MSNNTPSTPLPDGSQKSQEDELDTTNSTTELTTDGNETEKQRLIEDGPSALKKPSKAQKGSRKRVLTLGSGNRTPKKALSTSAKKQLSSPSPDNPKSTPASSTTAQRPKRRGRPRKHTPVNRAGPDPDAHNVHVPSSETSENVVFTPNPGPQTNFFAANEREVLYGGSAGGGKTFALIVDPIRYLTDPRCSALLLRRTTEELREIIWKTQELYPQVFPGIKWSERKSQWVHPSGGRIWMSYLDRDEDVLRYQGQAFNWIGFDELTQWPTPFAWNYLRSRLRSAGSSLPLFMRASTNPGNVGGWWVRKMFIDPAPPGYAFPATDIETGEMLTFPTSNPKHGEPLFLRRFIPSRLSDNPYLAEDGQYEANLLSLPEHQRAQLLDGSWDIIEGAAFPEWNRKVHVIEPFAIPDHWRKFRALDYGFSSYSGLVWFAVHPSGQLIVYRDLEVSKVTAWDLADRIKEIEDAAQDNVEFGVMDFSIGAARGQRGPSLVEQLQRHRLRWRPGDRDRGSRIASKNMLHRLLQVDEFTGEPGIVFFSTATNCIAQLPIIPLDKNNPEDVDTKSRDHIYDAIRYGIMTRAKPFDEFDMFGGNNLKVPQWKPADEILGY